ncbi:hypothetical protein CYJ73_19360 [Gordonia terrae]|uniref:Uncharacterized protein n=1 Tax=Gordonia terrae TaxID=2055 RepID=A0A2I1R491_9ACTN|nr:hypothetical protein CYJ73_19360 [Gordonia terrae]
MMWPSPGGARSFRRTRSREVRRTAGSGVRNLCVVGDETCRCGHDRAAHEHYRAGTDCALCGTGDCPRFRRNSRVRRLLGALPGARGSGRPSA